MEKVQKYSVVVAVILLFILMNALFLFLYYAKTEKRAKREIIENYEIKIISLENQINRYEMTITDLQELDSNTAELFIGLLRNHE